MWNVGYPFDQQTVLVDRLVVSRLPLREARKTLAAESLVVDKPHRGYFVAELSLADLREVHHIQGILEAEAVRRAVGQMDAATFDNIETLQREIEADAAAGDVAAMPAANRRFPRLPVRDGRHARLL